MLLHFLVKPGHPSIHTYIYIYKYLKPRKKFNSNFQNCWLCLSMVYSIEVDNCQFMKMTVAYTMMILSNVHRCWLTMPVGTGILSWIPIGYLATPPHIFLFRKILSSWIDNYPLICRSMDGNYAQQYIIWQWVSITEPCALPSKEHNYLIFIYFNV